MSAQKVTVVDMLVMIDTLRASLLISDNGMMFAYTAAAREATMRKLFAIANGWGVEVDAE